AIALGTQQWACTSMVLTRLPATETSRRLPRGVPCAWSAGLCGTGNIEQPQKRIMAVSLPGQGAYRDRARESRAFGLMAAPSLGRLFAQRRHVLRREPGRGPAEPARDVVGDGRDLGIAVGRAEGGHRYRAGRQASRAGNDDLRDIGRGRIVDR